LFAGFFVALDDNKSSEAKRLLRKERKSARGGSLCVNGGPQNSVSQNDQPGSADRKLETSQETIPGI
jgi:hypothetical protein